ncbi:MAG: T9SS type A sorting domain-containing protein, partial [Bacteroidetes bacterium]|nr:T9SS type A sorting domain-containing protein [Bacteroidota bacterium]
DVVVPAERRRSLWALAFGGIVLAGVLLWAAPAATAQTFQGMFLLDIDFATQNVGSEGFTITANGEVFGPFNYGEPFYTIGPLQSGVLYEIIIQDVENPDCHKFYSLAPVSCNGDCHIYDLVAEVSDCDDDGHFYVTIDFQYNDVGNDGFKIYGNGNVYGYFSYDDLPVTIGPLGTDNQQLEFGAADAQHPDCHDFAVVQTPDCNGSGGGDCHIFDLVADVHPCLPNGTFYVTLNVQHANTSDFFKVQGNGIVYGIFSYDDLPVEIGPLVGNGTTPYEFVLRDLHHPDCADDISIGTVECAGGADCEIHDLIADPGECHPDDTYNLWVWFDYENPGNNFYDVYHNGTFVDYFHLSHIPTTLPHLTANDEPLQTVTVCINDNPNCCQSVQYEAPDCDGLVWPGDPNFDNQSNNFDLLNLGLAFGAEGPHRAVQGIEWTGLQAENWGQLFADNLDFKHADCNGDGIVSLDDQVAVQNNFGETHGEPLAPVFLVGGESDPPFFVDLPEASGLTPGSIFTAPILLGTSDAPVENLYGIAFTMKFDPDIVNPASVELQYDPSWLGVKDVNLLTLDKTFADAGEIKVALVRTDQNNVSGYGQIAGIIGIIDNIAGKETASIQITDVKAIRENESLVSLRRPVEVVDLTVDGTIDLTENDLVIFPNPATTSVFFTLPDGLTAETVELRDVNGKLLSLQTTSENRLNISKLASGVYFLKVKSGERFFQNKVVKF